MFWVHKREMRKRDRDKLIISPIANAVNSTTTVCSATRATKSYFYQCGRIHFGYLMTAFFDNNYINNISVKVLPTDSCLNNESVLYRLQLKSKLINKYLPVNKLK